MPTWTVSSPICGMASAAIDPYSKSICCHSDFGVAAGQDTPPAAQVQSFQRRPLEDFHKAIGSPDSMAFFLPISSTQRPIGALSAHLAHLALQVVWQADFVDQFDLGFQKIDVLFGVVQNALQQVA